MLFAHLSHMSLLFCLSQNRQRPFCMPKQGSWSFIESLFLCFLYLRPLRRVCTLPRFLRLSFSQDSRGFYHSARNGVAAPHGSKSLTRCRRFSPLDSLSALLAPTCLDCNDTPPIRSLTLTSRPNKVPANKRNVFHDVFLNIAHIGYCYTYL